MAALCGLWSLQCTGQGSRGLQWECQEASRELLWRAAILGWIELPFLGVHGAHRQHALLPPCSAAGPPCCHPHCYCRNPAPHPAPAPHTLPSPAGEDIEKRTALEKRFQELCDREAALMAEIATLRKEVEA